MNSTFNQVLFECVLLVTAFKFTHICELHVCAKLWKHVDGMVNQIYPSKLQLNNANLSDTQATFLDLQLTISDGFVSSKIYDKHDDVDFNIVNFPFLERDIPRTTSYGVYISKLIRFVRGSSHVADFNTRNKILTAKLLKEGYRYHKLRKTFSKFYRRNY